MTATIEEATLGPPTDGYRYEELIGFIKSLIDGGVLAPGSRLPSLRKISRQRALSLSTALQAYRCLEDQGVIEARPQSGFFVARKTTSSFPPPAVSDPPRRALDVSVSRMVLDLLEYAADPRLVPLGCAIPGADLLAAGGLDRFLARAARVKGTESNVYTGPRGDLRLRQEIARRVSLLGRVVSPEEIVITCGCTEALMLALKAVAPPGAVVAVESPTYFGVLHVLEALGLRALELPTSAAEGVDPAALDRALATGTVAACLFSSGIQNPLGFRSSDERKRAIATLVARHGVPLIEDDIYGDLHFGSDRPRPFLAFDAGGDTLYCSSFSKTIAPGYRIGWIVAGRHQPKVLEHKFASTLCGPALPQIAFADYLASGGYDRHLRRIRRVFENNVGHMLRAVEGAFPAGTRVSRPAGGFVLWLELPEPLKSRELLDAALREGICFAPGDVFSASGRYANCLRLSCGHMWDHGLERGIARLGALAARGPARTSRLPS